MYQHILLPTDGSDAARTATEHAASLARAYDATVHVLSVVDTRNRFESPSGGIAPDVWEQSERSRAQSAVETTVAALPDDVEVEHVVREGIPQTQIVDYVDESAVDVVVMGTHGRTGLDHYLIGSVTERVVRNSSAPVLTVRGDEA